MDWFTSLDGVDELETAEAFLSHFGVSFDPVQVRSKRLHIMHHFNQALRHANAERCLSAQDRFLLAKTLLEDSYQTFDHQAVKEHSTLGVYNRLHPSFVPMTELIAVTL